MRYTLRYSKEKKIGDSINNQKCGHFLLISTTKLRNQQIQFRFCFNCLFFLCVSKQLFFEHKKMAMSIGRLPPKLVMSSVVVVLVLVVVARFADASCGGCGGSGGCGSGCGGCGGCGIGSMIESPHVIGVSMPKRVGGAIMVSRTYKPKPPPVLDFIPERRIKKKYIVKVPIEQEVVIPPYQPPQTFSWSAQRTDTVSAESEPAPMVHMPMQKCHGCGCGCNTGCGGCAMAMVPAAVSLCGGSSCGKK